MRTLTNKLILAAASLALVLGVAGQASALSSIGLTYLGGDGVQGGCDSAAPDCIHVEVSDTLLFAITMTVDSLGMSAYAFDLQWDADSQDELDLTFFRARGSLNVVTSPGPPPESAGYNLNTVFVTSDGATGSIEGFDAIPTSPSPPYAASVSFRLAVVGFHVTGNVDKDGTADVGIAFLRGPAFNTFGTAGFQPITPNFGSFTVDSVPEPGTSLLMGMGVLGLILAGRASRKS